MDGAPDREDLDRTARVGPADVVDGAGEADVPMRSTRRCARRSGRGHSRLADSGTAGGLGFTGFSGLSGPGVPPDFTRRTFFSGSGMGSPSVVRVRSLGTPAHANHIAVVLSC
jgi:hypothetical protein